MAIRVADSGRHVLLLQRGDAADTIDEIQRRGGSAEAVPVDLTDVEATEMMIRDVVRKWRGLDVLVSGASTITREPAHQVTTESFVRDVTIGLVTPFVLTRELAASRLVRGLPASVVFIASVLAFQGGLRVPAYSSAKGGLINLARALSNEWAGSGIRVNTVAPGYVRTEFTAALYDDAERKASIDERIPAGRWATPEDIASAVNFLIGAEAGYINGETLVVDGGWLGR